MNRNFTKQLAALFLSLIMTLVPMLAFADDYGNHWAAASIDEAQRLGWMSGDGNGNFRPDDPITRGEFTFMLWRALSGIAPENDCPFTDIPDDAFYRDAVTDLYERNIVSGFGNALFAPDNMLSREMGFAMLARSAQFSSKTEAYKRFSDHADVSAWARASLSAMTENSYVKGVGGNLCAPQTPMTRGEMATLLITVNNGEKQKASNLKKDTAKPVVTLTPNTTANTIDDVEITVNITSDNDIAFVGYCESSLGEASADSADYNDITASKRFTVSKNGDYTVLVKDLKDNFKLTSIRVNNIQTENSKKNSSNSSQGKNNGDGGTDNGNGTASNPFKIKTVAQLQALGTGIYELDKHYILMNALDLGGVQNWTPIGTEVVLGTPGNYYIDSTKAFTGTFNGNGKTISNLTINEPTAEYQDSDR